MAEGDKLFGEGVNVAARQFPILAAVCRRCVDFQDAGADDGR